MKTIALVTQKGGAGKTTLAASIAVAAMEAGETVIALDLDPQGSLAAWGEQRRAEAPAVDSVPADKMAQLPQILKALGARGYTLAILDCPGVASTGANIAMQAADLSLVPARPTRLDIQATRPTIQALLKLQRPFLFVLNQCPPMPRSSRANEAAVGLSAMGSLAEPLMASRADYQDAIAAGQGVTEYAPNGKAADEARQLWQCIELKMNPKPKAMTA
jgi:chromosome partitioning protein